MSHAKTVAILALVSGAILAVVVLDRFVEARRQQHFDLAVALQKLTRSQNDLAEEVLRLRQNPIHHYDGVVEIQRRAKEAEARIEALLRTAIADPELRRAYRSYLAAAQAQRDSVEQFKSMQSLDRNSRRYLSVLASSIVSAAGAPVRQDAIAEEIDQIVVDSLAALLNSSPDQTLLERIADLAVRIESRGLDDSGGVRVFLDHAAFALRNLQTLERVTQTILEHEARLSIDALRVAHEETLAASLKTADTQRVVLMAIVMGFGLLIVSAHLRLRATNAALASRNEGLEEEIRHRSAQIAQNQKLESIGQLAAGVAHEINTPAQYVGDNLEFLQQSLDEIQPLLERCTAIEKDPAGSHASTEGIAEPLVELSRIAEAVDLEFLVGELPRAVVQSREGIGRISEIVRAMKEFSHPGSDEKKPVDLNHAIESTVTVARNEWKYVAEVETELDPALPWVPVLAGEFNQVILNIVVNAAHAIAGVEKASGASLGRIGIRTGIEGSHAVIAISDDGPGIPAEIVDRIFDPFFTTKEVGKGTGQGLAIARSTIVDKQGGSISVDTEVGRGTTFEIRIPLAPDPSTEKAS
jgi:signal transduction histidine kinase